MDVINEAIVGLGIGKPAVFGNLAVFPLFGDAANCARYTVLDEALEAGSARVTEVSDDGSVPELRFENLGESPVLLLDGEELVGAKQNRVLNLSILAPAQSAITIPVSCVEAGRWAWRSEAFSSSERAQYAGLRARRMAQVSGSLADDGTARSDQQAVWDDIAVKMQRMEAPSDSGAMTDIYERFHQPLEEYVAAFKAEKHQVGAVFAVNGECRGAEFFDSSKTFERQFKKLLRSWGLDAIDSPAGNGADAGAADAKALLGRAAALTRSGYPASGLGENVRLDGDGFGGAALVVEGRVIHLCVFRTKEPESDFPQ